MTEAGRIRELRDSLAGAVLTPSDAGYDAARVCFNGLVDRRPAVIAQCVGAADVATAFDFARMHDLDVAVRGGGHNPAGHCMLDDGLVIDLSRMCQVDVDGQTQVADAGGGSTWLDFDAATQEHGLVTPGGVVGSTGVCGLTLGGGIGHLTAQYGLTCDNLVGAELVTPDGTVVHASADENPELLWGLRGGGGNFGVATRLTFRLHQLGAVIGGEVAFKGDGAREALRRFRDVVHGSPLDLSCQAVIGVDEALMPTVVLFPCYTGDAADPPELRALRSGPGLVHDTVGKRSFLEQQALIDSEYGRVRRYWKGHFTHGLPDELIEELLERVVALGRPPGGILIESLHGAPKDGSAPEAAVAWRDAAFNVSATAGWEDPAHDESSIAWSRDTAAALERWSFGGGYVNYMQADEPIERIRAAYGDEAFARLQALKRRYDPTNVLRRNQNIPPGTLAIPSRRSSG
jgi:FAD/FMN-containing dehydrogenase